MSGIMNGDRTLVMRDDDLKPVVADNGEFANLLDSSKFGHLQRVAALFAASNMVPEHYRNNVANCFIAIEMSTRMKVNAFAFMQGTYIVHNKPGMEAKLVIALINMSGLFVDSLDYEIEGDNPNQANYRVRAYATRASSKKVVHGPWIDWNLVRAEKWDSKSDSKWKSMPGIMFQYRAAMFFGRLHCPERLMGMQTVEELTDVNEARPVPSRVVSSSVPATPADLNEALDAEIVPVEAKSPLKAEEPARASVDATKAPESRKPPEASQEVAADEANDIQRQEWADALATKLAGPWSDKVKRELSVKFRDSGGQSADFGKVMTAVLSLAPEQSTVEQRIGFWFAIHDRTIDFKTGAALSRV